MSTLTTVFEEMDKVARAYGWALALGSKTQDDPAQHQLILTHELPAEQSTLGVHVEDEILAGDFFGGVPGGEKNDQF